MKTKRTIIASGAIALALPAAALGNTSIEASCPSGVPTYHGTIFNWPQGYTPPAWWLINGERHDAVLANGTAILTLPIGSSAAVEFATGDIGGTHRSGPLSSAGCQAISPPPPPPPPVVSIPPSIPSRVTPKPRLPRLVIQKMGPATMAAGGFAIFKVRVKNIGKAQAYFIVRDRLPSGLVFANRNQSATGVLLRPGQEKVLVYRVRALTTASGKRCNVVTARVGRRQVRAQACTVIISTVTRRTPLVTG